MGGVTLVPLMVLADKVGPVRLSVTSAPMTWLTEAVASQYAGAHVIQPRVKRNKVVVAEAIESTSASCDEPAKLTGHDEAEPPDVPRDVDIDVR